MQSRTLSVLLVVLGFALAWPAAGGEGEGGKEEKLEASRDKLDQLRSDYQPYAFNFYSHEPVYFGVGVNPKESKLQVSFRYQFISEDGELAKNHPWTKGFNLGYTQTSLWDLQSTSAPFKDTSYKPELFYLSPLFMVGPSWARGFLVQTGFRHESNGRDGIESRSTNYLYGKMKWLIELGESYALLVSPEVFAYVGKDNKTNAELDKYRGYFDLEVKLAKKHGASLATNYRHGTKGWAVETAFNYPLHNIANKNFELYFFVQRFDGYAESLLEFTEKEHSTRIGFSLIH